MAITAPFAVQAEDQEQRGRHKHEPDRPHECPRGIVYGGRTHSELAGCTPGLSLTTSVEPPTNTPTAPSCIWFEQTMESKVVMLSFER